MLQKASSLPKKSSKNIKKMNETNNRFQNGVGAVVVSSQLPLH